MSTSDDPWLHSRDFVRALCHRGLVLDHGEQRLECLVSRKPELRDLLSINDASRIVLHLLDCGGACGIKLEEALTEIAIQRGCVSHRERPQMKKIKERLIAVNVVN